MASPEPGRTAIVTGASSGIGAVYARALAARGHRLVLVARRADRLAALAGELRAAGHPEPEVLVADLGDDGGLARAAERAGRDDVELLVNNAGLSGYAPFAEADPGVLAAVIRLNALAPTLLTRAAIAGMVARRHGAVINVASLLAFAGALPPDPLPHRATYAGTKAYMVAFTRTLAAELDGSGVTLQVCCPGYTQSEFHLTTGSDPVGDAVAEDDPRAMRAEDVVQASLAALERGEVVVVPGLEDPDALEALAAAELAVRTGSGRRLAQRYGPAARP